MESWKKSNSKIPILNHGTTQFLFFTFHEKNVDELTNTSKVGTFKVRGEVLVKKKMFYQKDLFKNDRKVKIYQNGPYQDTVQKYHISVLLTNIKRNNEAINVASTLKKICTLNGLSSFYRALLSHLTNKYILMKTTF